MPKNKSSDKRPRRTNALGRKAAALLALVVVAACAPLAAAAFSRTAAPQEDELRIELSTAGFAQAEVTHAAGAFAIAVDNLDVEDEYVLQLKGEGGALLKEIRVQRGSATWSVELAAGSYTLMVANRPNWFCRIVIQ